MNSRHRRLSLGGWAATAARVALGAFLFGFAADRVNAQWWCPDWFPPGNPPSQPPSQKCKTCETNCKGSPCYVGSGAYETAARDLTIRTTGFPLAVSRNYLSTQLIDGPMGIGWSPSPISRVYYATYLFAAPSTYQKEADFLMPDGSRYRFVDNGDGTFTPPPGRHDTVIHNADGTFDLTLQRTRSAFHFNSVGGLVSMTDDYGNALTWSYDGSGRVQQIADSSGSGRYLNVFWGPDGRISSIQDSAGRQVQYTYNAQGALATVTDPASRVTTYSYVTGRFSPQLSGVTDNWGRVVTTVTYDSVGRTKTYTESGETYTYTHAYQGYAYQDNPAVTSKSDSQGHVYTYSVSPDGLITDPTPPSGGGGPTHTDYTADGSVQQLIDAVGVKTFYTYTADGSLLTATRDYLGPNAVRFDYTYDPSFPSKVTSITPKNPSTNAVDPTWQAWSYDYYQTGDPAPGALRHVYRVHDDGVTLDTLATYTYDSHGRITRVTSATGGVTDYVYDAQGNLQTVTGAANNDAGTRPVTTYGYDSLGRVTSVTDPLNHATTYAYDALDRVASVTLPKPSTSSTLTFLTTYSYDNFDSPSGLVFVNVTDPNSRVTKQGYDQYGQLVKSTDAANNATTYAYTRGLLTSITDANGNATSYGYDSGRRLTITSFPDNSVERYTYTSDSLLYQKSDRNNYTMTVTYDHFKRLATKTYATLPTITYTYQGQKLTQVVDTSVSPTETHTFAYDSSYRLQSETQAGRGTITRTYNADDTLATMTVQSGPAATYSYYPDGSLNTIQWSPVAGNFKYNYTLPGQYQAINFPNSQSRNFTYDDQGRLTQLSNLAAGGTNVATYGYGYDLNYTTGQNTMLGQRVSLTATVPSQGLSNHLTKYEYDPLYQLNKVTYPNVAPLNGEVDSWTYDAIGNRLTNTVNGSTTNYTYQKIGANPLNWQRLTSDGSNSYTYDSNGSALTRTGYTFAYNPDNRMVSISGATTASYLHDYQGRRSTKTVGSATTYFYDGLNLVREAGASSADYLFGPGIDEPLAMNRGGQVYYYAADGLNSTAGLTNSGGVVQNNYLYDAWGVTKSQTEAVANPFTYTAREKGEAGTLFFRARYLSPAIGRFLQEDPSTGSMAPLGFSSADIDDASQVGIDLSVNSSDAAQPYPYVGNEPVDYVDPYGLQKKPPPMRPPPGLPPLPLPDPGKWRRVIPPRPPAPPIRPINPGRAAGCASMLRGCLLVCRCIPQPVLKAGCIAGCFALYVACVGVGG